MFHHRRALGLQDVKKGKLREYEWGDMMFNYGALPQTWEDPTVKCRHSGCLGDNDPLDVVDIGTRQWTMGSIVRLKPLGALALIDEGETDWCVRWRAGPTRLQFHQGLSLYHCVQEDHRDQSGGPVRGGAARHRRRVSLSPWGVGGLPRVDAVVQAPDCEQVCL